MNPSMILQNKKAFAKYTAFRKQIFIELAPKESEVILYLLPWLLSINHRSCPGYLPELEKSFRVHGINNDKEIRKRESGFKRQFGIVKKGTLLDAQLNNPEIEGTYTIGSAGTVSQNVNSDCDIWICYDKDLIPPGTRRKLIHKINRIQEWLDGNLRIPVYLFICEVHDIRKNRFGSIDTESAGSTQRNVLKEEFYRTCMVISGKIPLWWIAYDPNKVSEYERTLQIIENSDFDHDDVIDLGDLAKIEKDEYFGAAVWHIHKSMKSPLKSIIKMVLLKILLDSPENLLICHHFRERVLNRETDPLLLDPSIFTILMIFRYLSKQNDIEQLEFMKKCFYLRRQAKPYERRYNLKKELLTKLYKLYPIPLIDRIRLGNYDQWRFSEQIELGNQIFALLFKTYRAITDSHTGIASDSDKIDLSILGRKLSASYLKKPFKIPVIQNPIGSLNVTSLRLALTDSLWSVFPENEKSSPLISSKDIVYNIAFMVWNRLFFPNQVSMEPNSTPVTLQEIINLGKAFGEFFGETTLADPDFSHYTKNERIVQLMIVVSFEQSPLEKDENDYRAVYKNNWGELFVRRLQSRDALETFLKNWNSNPGKIDIRYYLQRNTLNFEKLLIRTKNIVLPLIF